MLLKSLRLWGRRPAAPKRVPARRRGRGRAREARAEPFHPLVATEHGPPSAWTATAVRGAGGMASACLPRRWLGAGRHRPGHTPEALAEPWHRWAGRIPRIHRPREGLLSVGLEGRPPCRPGSVAADRVFGSDLADTEVRPPSHEATVVRWGSASASCDKAPRKEEAPRPCDRGAVTAQGSAQAGRFTSRGSRGRSAGTPIVQCLDIG